MADNYIYGFHAVSSALRMNPQCILALYASAARDDTRMQGVMELAQDLGIAIRVRSREELDQMVGSKSHQGIIANCQVPKPHHEQGLYSFIEEREGQPLLFLVLDSVQDPHNLGACLRSADAAGVHGVIIPKDKAAALTATVLKVSSGAAFTVPLYQVTNLARVLRGMQQRGVWLVGTDGAATQGLYEVDLSGSVAIVMGSEGKGLRRLTREHCDFLVKIPMQGSVESLNVSVATGICLFEAQRQRLNKSSG